MKITSIKQQVKRTDRYSVFIDGKYGFSLSAEALLASGLVPGQEISEAELKDLKKTSGNDKLYNQTLRFVALRPRSRWEIATYLRRKKADEELQLQLLNKLSNIGLIDDEAFARSFVSDRRLLRHTSRRKLTQELRQKHVPDEIIQAALGEDPQDERSVLKQLIEQKRRQSKYRDELKLMQYLARQGFNYGDIKDALNDKE